MAALDSARATSFGTFAEEYALWRPTYPDTAVDWLLPPSLDAGAHVADVGAGTGQLTGLLLARGLRVSAVEPDCDMLAVLTHLHPGAEPHLAAAESLPFADHSLDAVLVGTAWHWFPVEAAVAEVRRVLRPGGRLGLVWNLVRPVADWEHELAGTDPDGKGTDHEAFAPPTSFPDRRGGDDDAAVGLARQPRAVRRQPGDELGRAAPRRGRPPPAASTRRPPSSAGRASGPARPPCPCTTRRSACAGPRVRVGAAPVGSPRYADGPPLPSVSSSREAAVRLHTVVEQPGSDGVGQRGELLVGQLDAGGGRVGLEVVDALSCPGSAASPASA